MTIASAVALAPAVVLAFLGMLERPGVVHAADVFEDVTKIAGIDYVQTSGAKGKKHLVETMAGGGGWIDYDGDGRLDIYFVNGHDDPLEAAKPGAQENRLYKNLGGGKFRDVTAQARVGDRGYGFGLAVGDIDNDGDSDLYVTNFGANVLYVNRGDGTFTENTVAAGVECPLWSCSAAFADINGDGWLDLYVGNYLIYDPHRHPACTGNPQKLPSYCHPNKYDGAPDFLYLNRGDGTFQDISRSAGIAVRGRILSKGLGVLPTDFDNDGDIDIFVANDSVPNFLWRNLGGGHFEDAGLEAGVSLNTNGKAEACMGIDGVDLNGDGWMDYYVTNFSQETDSLFISDGDGFFEDATYRSGLARPTHTPLGFGTRFLDFDLDGDFDIYVARGHVLDNISQLHPGGGLLYAQPDQLFVNDGKGRFRDVSSASGVWFKERRVGRAAAFADYDDDGDLDILLVHIADRAVLLRNNAIESGGKHWIGFALRGAGRSPRDAYGARVTVRTPNGVVMQEVRSTSSYLSASDSRLIVGLGAFSGPVESVQVRWPSGGSEEFSGLQAGKYHTLRQGTGSRK